MHGARVRLHTEFISVTGVFLGICSLAAMPAPPVVVVAKHSYSKSGDNILNFARGDLLEILEETNAKWWAARMLKDEEAAGYIPASYVEVRIAIALARE